MEDGRKLQRRSGNLANRESADANTHSCLADDIRVYVGEDYLLERALHTMGIPSALLVFPGEGHSLANNPWHGK